MTRPASRRLSAALALAVAAGLAVPAAAQSLPGVEGFLAAPKRAAPMPEGRFRLAPRGDPSRRAEAVQGEANFVRIASLPEADPNRALSAMVGQIWVRRGESFAPLCSGFLVGPDLFMTNFHCVADMASLQPTDPRSLMIAMAHLAEGDVGGAETVSPVLGVKKMDYELDYALIALERRLGDRFGWLALETDRAAIGRAQAVKIIQHPDGRPKEIVLEDTEMVQQDALFMHYMADTEGGSSGSPVFELAGERVIGLHHVGTRSYNEGVRMARIAEEVALYLPETAGAPAAAPAPAAVAAVQPAAAGAGAAGTVLELLRAPPPPLTEAERAEPLSLGLPPAAGAGAGQPEAAGQGAAGGEQNFGIGGGGQSGTVKLNFD
ncbi:hypothetical protein LNKW23_05720 [Paralimibaculum aggregatum]|uniref:Serine protease n=1 Tax=Paralimibaculum aggregatum TaxID=3036245 RepID=A0ABQ6LL22_9RHOB|nr:serine protease [Limibaculum sp. NKW23]GMG81359.1 hypothetical protein LNKW23_05720 [Limibaculum sp. NKW23]